MQLQTYETKGGVRVHREIAVQPYSPADSALAERLDDRRGVLFSSSFEFPGRYTRWDMGFVDPPLVLTARGRDFAIEALNERGAVLLPAIGEHLAGLDAVRIAAKRRRPDRRATSARAASAFRRNSAAGSPRCFRCCASLGELFASPEDEHLGLYGAFGYDLVFQFEPMTLKLARPDDQRDLVLYLPDEILIVDHMRQQSAIHRYEFEVGGPFDRRAAARDRAGAVPLPSRRCRCRRKAITAPANTPRWCGARRRPSCAAICSRSSAASFSRPAARTRRASSSGGCAGPIRRPTGR